MHNIYLTSTSFLFNDSFFDCPLLRPRLYSIRSLSKMCGSVKENWSVLINSSRSAFSQEPATTNAEACEWAKYFGRPIPRPQMTAASSKIIWSRISAHLDLVSLRLTTTTTTKIMNYCFKPVSWGKGIKVICYTVMDY